MKEETKAAVDKILDRTAKNIRAGAKGIVTPAIGDRVLSLVAETGDVSLPALLESFQHDVDNAASVKGSTSREMDIKLHVALAVIERIEGLLADRSAD